jgi:DNA primase
MDKKLEKLHADLAVVDDAYRTLTAPLAWAKAEAGIDPSDDDEKRVSEIVARREKLWAQIREQEKVIAERARGSG